MKFKNFVKSIIVNINRTFIFKILKKLENIINLKINMI